MINRFVALFLYFLLATAVVGGVRLPRRDRSAGLRQFGGLWARRQPPIEKAARPRWKQVGKAGLVSLNWGTNILLVIALVAVIGMLFAPQLFGWRYGILRSGSMSPDMPTGAAIVVAPVNPGEVRPGDVITFRSASNQDLLITHRVVEADIDAGGNPVFITKGDANDAPDAAIVTADRLLGRVKFDLPYVGLVIRHLRSTTAFILLMVIPATMLVGLELREFAGGVSDLMKKRKKAVA